MSYPSFSSIERLENLYCHITEKVDGTNGLIYIGDKYEAYYPYELIRFGSRNRWITTEDDNCGFANFFSQYKAELDDIIDLIRLEKGEVEKGYSSQIYGEWFGKGIQRGYNLEAKFFMPFSEYFATKMIDAGIAHIKMPVTLYSGKFSVEILEGCMNKLKDEGSQVVPGYNRPEGVVVYFPKHNFRLKETFEGPKWKDAIPKAEHDKKPKEKTIRPECPSCGKHMYQDKKTMDFNCMNFHCPSSLTYKKE